MNWPSFPTEQELVDAIALLRQAVRIANRAVVAEIECECLATPDEATGLQWWDTTPMLSPHEHSGPVIDMATHALRYAAESDLIEHHPRHHHLVRILRRPD